MGDNRVEPCLSTMSKSRSTADTFMTPLFCPLVNDTGARVPSNVARKGDVMLSLVLFGLFGGGMLPGALVAGSGTISDSIGIPRDHLTPSRSPCAVPKVDEREAYDNERKG